MSLLYRSGDQRFGVRMGRAMFRACVEKGMRMLNEADRESERVVRELRREPE